MKIIFYTICGVIGTVLVTLLFNYISGFQLQSFSLWLVIPVGGIYVGLGAVSGLYYYIFKHNKQFLLTSKIYLVSLILGLVTLLGIYYISYLKEYAIPANKAYMELESISFIKYLKIEATSGESFFAVKNMPINQGIDMGGTINLIYFYTQLLGVLIGSLWPMFLKVFVKVLAWYNKVD